MSLPSTEQRVGAQAVAQGLISAEQLAEASAAHAAAAGATGSLGALLVARGWISADQLLALDAVDTATTQAHPATGGVSGLDDARTTIVASPPPSSAAERTLADPLVGQTLSAKYAIEARIGRGGMGSVYRARHLGLDRTCAIKILPPEMTGDDTAVARFQREARATAALDERNVVRIHDVDHDLGLHYLAMELVEGESLADRTGRDGALVWRDAVGLMAEAADGLAAAHAQGIVHRDIKPHNLMVTHDGVLKVADFGLASLAASTSQISSSGQVVGTPHFMSPEQASGATVGEASDIYSLGATLYVLVTGQLPFRADSPARVMMKVVGEPHVPPSQHRSDLPEGLCRLLDRVMAKAPADRPPSMVALAAELRGLLDGTITPPAPAARPRGRRGTAVRAVLAVGAVALVLAVWRPWSRSPAPPTPPTAASGPRSRPAPDPDAFGRLTAALARADVTPADKHAACLAYLEDASAARRGEVERLRDQWAAEVATDRGRVLAALGVSVGGHLAAGRHDDAARALVTFTAAHPGLATDPALVALGRRVAAARPTVIRPPPPPGATAPGYVKAQRELLADRPGPAAEYLRTLHGRDPAAHRLSRRLAIFWLCRGRPEEAAADLHGAVNAEQAHRLLRLASGADPRSAKGTAGAMFSRGLPLPAAWYRRWVLADWLDRLETNEGAVHRGLLLREQAGGMVFAWLEPAGRRQVRFARGDVRTLTRAPIDEAAAGKALAALRELSVINLAGLAERLRLAESAAAAEPVERRLAQRLRQIRGAKGLICRGCGGTGRACRDCGGLGVRLPKFWDQLALMLVYHCAGDKATASRLRIPIAAQAAGLEDGWRAWVVRRLAELAG